jgi:ADP-ribose pyrophosphatase YjhB (NUDIX family)
MQRVTVGIRLPDRADPARHLPGTRLRHGEDPGSAALRAAREVLGLDVAVTGPREALADVADDPDQGITVHTVRLVYGARPLGPATGDGAGDRADGHTRGGPQPAPPDGEPPDRPRQVQRPGAYALVVDAGRVLLSRYARTGRWSLPGGGIDHGEQPIEALRREVHEETGQALDDARLVGVDSAHFTGRSPRGLLEDFHAVRIIYAATVSAGARPRVLEVDGTADAAAWVALEDLDRIEVTSLVRTFLELPA